MTLADLLAGKPSARVIAGAREETRRGLLASGTRMVVVDDDPTGGQTIQDARVYMEWSVPVLRRALASGDPVFFLSCNTRSLAPAEAAGLAGEVGRNLAEAARESGIPVLLTSRSDSTLRGHYPHEVDALISGFGERCDGVLIVPAFFEAGRTTIGDTQWVQQGEEVVSAEQTEFARDPVFAYRNGNLRRWVEEKTGGAVQAGEVRSISLERIRTGGPDGVAADLMDAAEAQPIVVNAACYEDLDTFVLGLAAAEARGRRFTYRCSASFVKARGGFPDRPLLSRGELQPGPGPGLVIAGSYVAKTSRQLDRLLATGMASGVELRVGALLDAGRHDQEIRRVARAASDALVSGFTAAVYTTREVAAMPPEAFVEAAQAVMRGLCEVVRRIEEAPGFVVAKGGITSTEVARAGLGVTEAMVLGQILPGVPVWRLGPESRWPALPYVVFPGNVGDEDALAQAVAILGGVEERRG